MNGLKMQYCIIDVLFQGLCVQNAAMSKSECFHEGLKESQVASNNAVAVFNCRCHVHLVVKPQFDERYLAEIPVKNLH